MVSSPNPNSLPPLDVVPGGGKRVDIPLSMLYRTNPGALPASLVQPAQGGAPTVTPSEVLALTNTVAKSVEEYYQAMGFRGHPANRTLNETLCQLRTAAKRYAEKEDAESRRDVLHSASSFYLLVAEVYVETTPHAQAMFDTVVNLLNAAAGTAGSE